MIDLPWISTAYTIIHITMQTVNTSRPPTSEVLGGIGKVHYITTIVPTNIVPTNIVPT